MRTLDKNHFYRLVKKHLRCIALLLSVCAMPHSVAAQTTGIGQWWEQTKDNVVDIYKNGKQELYLSGYAYHGRNTYTAERIEELNERI